MTTITMPYEDFRILEKNYKFALEDLAKLEKAYKKVHGNPIIELLDVYEKIMTNENLAQAVKIYRDGNL